MAKITLRLVLLGLTLSCAGHAFATGYFGPEEYLIDGGGNIVASPEFYWDLETKRLAKDFHPTEKPVAITHTVGGDGTVDPAPMIKATADADTADFADALKTGAIKPPDPAKATQANDDARNAIASLSGTATTAATLPGEFDSEFADYHRGANAFRAGQTHWDEAKKAWEALLNRPVGERHYRTLWATFMLGKLAMKSGDYATAVKWFEKTRELAKQGFADSLGMAADSYGWQGRSEWKWGHPEKAAPLFLTQLALGDESAVVSLKALIPDRDPSDGMLNYGPDASPDALKPDNSPPPPLDPKVLASLKEAAMDPLLRRLVTAHILATGWGSGLPGFTPDASNTRGIRWLKMISELKSGPVEDAEYLGWLSYMNGDYKEAQRWVALAKADSPAADWLRAKLQLRDGHVDEAVKSLSKAIDTLRSPGLYTGWKDGAFSDANEHGPGYVTYDDDSDSVPWSMTASASGDLGGMHLERGDFIQAMDILLKGGLWSDASFIAERVLTANELKEYVDKLPATPATPPDATKGLYADSGKNSDAAAEDYTKTLRYLLGRRLVREDRYDEAAKYLSAPYDKIVQKYAAALKDGADESLPKPKRAQAWFTAAWLARYDGMELMGTEVAPDSFVSDGDFENSDVAQERLSGHYTKQDYSGNGPVKSTTEKNFLTTSPAERQRLEKNKIEPDTRYHYRYIAAALAMRAAALMDDNTEELADVMNTAGKWIMNSDDKLADRYYQVIEKRAPQTTIGKSAAAKHWFVDNAGPWSTAQQTAYDAMHKALGDDKSNGQ